MGWDNAWTVAQEVEEPQRNYPRAMLTAAGLVALTYVLPLAAVGLAGIPADSFRRGRGRMRRGSWWGRGWRCAWCWGDDRWGGDVQCADDELYAGAVCDGRGGSAAGGGGEEEPMGVPWVSVVVCSVGWALALRLSFERLISIDLVLYGAALMLEFVALVVLRVREPGLARPFRVPGGIWGTVTGGGGAGGC